MIQESPNYFGAREKAKGVIDIVLRNSSDEGGLWKAVDRLRSSDGETPAIMSDKNFEPSEDYIKYVAEYFLRMRREMRGQSRFLPEYGPSVVGQ